MPAVRKSLHSAETDNSDQVQATLEAGSGSAQTHKKIQKNVFLHMYTELNQKYFKSVAFVGFWSIY